MSNAAKHRKKAAEFEQLKQIDRAIASYVRAIEASEMENEDVDVALLNKVGDLALRQGRVPDAVTYYERAVEHYATAGLFNNAIALCNKILRNAPGRSNVYFTLGRICARKGLRGDATRNFLEYASRMQQERRVEEAMRALGEVADLMPDLVEVRRLVEEHAVRIGVALKRRATPTAPQAEVADDTTRGFGDKSSNLVFLDVDYTAGHAATDTPVQAQEAIVPASSTTMPTPVVALPMLEVVTFDDELEVAPASVVFEDEVGGVASILESTVEFATASATSVSQAAAVIIDAPDVGAQRERPVAGVFTADADLTNNILASPTENPDSIAAFVELDLVDLPLGDDAMEPSLTIAEPTQAEAPVADDLGELIGDPFFSDAEIAPVEIELIPLVEATPAAAIATDDTESGAVSSSIIDDAFDVLSDIAIAGSTPPFAAPVIDLEPIIDGDGQADAPHDATAQEPARTARQRTPFRLDPHNFILPGELQPLIVDDAIVDAGLRQYMARGAPASPLGDVESALAAPFDRIDDYRIDDYRIDDDRIDEDRIDEDRIDEDRIDEDRIDDATALAVDNSAAYGVALQLTPSLPIAAVALEANAVALARRDALKASVAETPLDWMLRRRLAEALLETGARDEALAELEAAVRGLSKDGKLVDAADVAELLVRVSPDRVAYHQKRVEFAVKLNDHQRLGSAYLDLGDALVRSGEEARAQAVYVRVLELNPLDDRARAALGEAAPPTPGSTAEPHQPDDEAVDLAEWLRDEKNPVATRMRMREPVASGDEQADFAVLLRHFKEGVSRSLGDEDFESRYDLGVAYKEMGLLDDAITEFQKALRSRAHRLPAYEALGQCFVEQERFQVATTVLSRALHEPGLDDGQRVGVLYLLAHSCEALQRWSEARSYFQRVHDTDTKFRDVAARLAALESIVQ